MHFKLEVMPHTVQKLAQTLLSKMSNRYGLSNRSTFINSAVHCWQKWRPLAKLPPLNELSGTTVKGIFARVPSLNLCPGTHFNVNGPLCVVVSITEKCVIVLRCDCVIPRASEDEGIDSWGQCEDSLGPKGDRNQDRGQKSRLRTEIKTEDRNQD